MDREKVRYAVIVALAADDELGELLVLKGGNALGLVHKIGERASLDVDYSIEGDFDNVDDVVARIGRALSAEFVRHGLQVFDVKMSVRPDLRGKEDLRPTWGGWAVEFKLISLASWAKYAGTPEKRRHAALELGGDKKAFQIDISKFEFVGETTDADVGGYFVRVYSPSMIVYEKLRALCQQISEYHLVAHPRPRPRDFVDIYSVLEKRRSDVIDRVDLLPQVFAVKEVPLQLLSLIATPEQRGFHEHAWTQVEQQLPNARTFEFYYDHVVAFIHHLETLGIFQSPT